MSAVERILRNATDFEWSVQGFGMFRLYLTDRTRLHVWDDRWRVPMVSDIHDHPWDLTSEIVAGEIRNDLFQAGGGPKIPTHYEQRIKPGEGGGPLDSPLPVQLELVSSFTYGPGEVYRQRAEDVHRSTPLNGTVTIATREGRREQDVAKSYFEASGPDAAWVSAEPRPATADEIFRMAKDSLNRWFGEASS